MPAYSIALKENEIVENAYLAQLKMIEQQLGKAALSCYKCELLPIATVKVGQKGKIRYELTQLPKKHSLGRRTRAIILVKRSRVNSIQITPKKLIKTLANLGEKRTLTQLGHNNYILDNLFQEQKHKIRMTHLFVNKNRKLWQSFTLIRTNMTSYKRTPPNEWTPSYLRSP